MLGNSIMVLVMELVSILTLEKAAIGDSTCTVLVMEMVTERKNTMMEKSNILISKMDHKMATE
jgi:hypothetical protein